jgi:hypothetical protein
VWTNIPVANTRRATKAITARSPNILESITLFLCAAVSLASGRAGTDSPMT